MINKSPQTCAEQGVMAEARTRDYVNTRVSLGSVSEFDYNQVEESQNRY